MRVLLLTRYGPLGASSRLRAYQYIPYLRSEGVTVTPRPLFGDYYQNDLFAGRSRRWERIAEAYLLRLWQLAHAPTFDLVWIEYELFPWLPALAERFLARLRIPYLVDYDDAIYHRYELHPSWIVRSILGKKIDIVMRRASVVVVANEYLAARAKSANARRVHCVPTVVDLSRYPAPSCRAVGGDFTIGWIGSPSTVKYLSLVRPVLAAFCRETKARVVVIGAREAPLEGVPAEVRPWSEDTEVADILRFDVGIMPLPDEPWERGKSGYKLIQYMACGRPVIASPVGVNRQIVEHGVNGFLAASDREWHSALSSLFADPELRMRLGSAGRHSVEANYCTSVTAPRLAAILKTSSSGDEVDS